MCLFLSIISLFFRCDLISVYKFAFIIYIHFPAHDEYYKCIMRRKKGENNQKNKKKKKIMSNEF